MVFFKFVIYLISIHFFVIPLAIATEFNPTNILIPWAVIKVKKAGRNGGLEAVKVDKRKITFKIWDEAIEDGDIVAIKLNENVVLNEYTLKKVPKVINLDLKSGENIVEIFSFNTGTVAENTAAIEISGVIEGKSTQSWLMLTREFSELKITAP